jgi:hypothetical protein
MSEVDDWMESVDQRLDWLVASMKHLLTREIAGEAPVAPPEPLPEPDLPIAAPVTSNGSCSHQHQTLVGRNVCCARCGHVIIPNTGVYDRPVLMPE